MDCDLEPDAATREIPLKKSLAEEDRVKGLG